MKSGFFYDMESINIFTISGEIKRIFCYDTHSTITIIIRNKSHQATIRVMWHKNQKRIQKFKEGDFVKIIGYFSTGVIFHQDDIEYSLFLNASKITEIK